MTVATFLQTDFTAQDAASYKAAIDGDVTVMARLASAFAPHAQATPNLTLRVDAGAVFAAGSLTPVASQTTGTFTAPVANPRIDRIVIDPASGALQAVTGTESATPVAPAIPSGLLPLAQVLLQPGAAAVTNAMITDERVTGNLQPSSGGAPSTSNFVAQNAVPRSFVAVAATFTGATYASSAGGMPSSDPDWSSVTFADHFASASDLTADSVGNVLTNNGATLSTAVGNPFGAGSAAAFSSGYIDLPYDRCNFPGDFTLETWIYALSPSTGYQEIIRTNGYLLFRVSTGVLQAQSAFGSIQSASSLSANVWTHVALTRQSNTYTLWINGVASGTLSSASTPSYASNAAHACEIGAYSGGQEPFNGYLSDFRITNGVARYTANFSVPTAAFSTPVNSAGNVQLSSAGAHGLAASPAVGANVSIAWSGGSAVSGFYKVLSVDSPTAFTVALAYAAGLGTPTVTPTGTNVVMASVAIPAGTVSANGSIEFNTFFDGTSSSNNKTTSWFVGATPIDSNAFTTGSQPNHWWLINRGTLDSQLYSLNNISIAGGIAVDFSQNQTLYLEAQAAAANEVITLEGYVVRADY